MLLKEGRQSGCKHWAETAGYYLEALQDTGAYPLELTFSRNSIARLTYKLGKFIMAHEGKCHFCKRDWRAQVALAREKTLSHFDGLCIDCMDKSRFKKGNQDEDYWRGLGNVEGRWDHGCRVRHGECTWYVSWCGRDEHRLKLLDMAKP